MASREWSRISDEDRPIVEKHIAAIPVRLGGMARELGIDVQLSALPPNCSGLIRKSGEDNYEIKINRYESRERQRFTLAHEIAHYLLHREKIDVRGKEGLRDDVLYRSGEPKNVEFEANRLAAEIVMPKAHLAERLEAFSSVLSENAIESLAEQFRVSRAAMEVRINVYSKWRT